MTAYNVVRFRVKPGRESEFVAAHRNRPADFAGFRRFSLIKTGERTYCAIGEWNDLTEPRRRASEDDRAARYLSRHAGGPRRWVGRDRSGVG